MRKNTNLWYKRVAFYKGCRFPKKLKWKDYGFQRTEYSIKALSIAKKSDFQSRILQTVHHLQGTDPRLTVQVGVHAGQRDYNQSFVLTPECQEISFYVVAMDNKLLYSF